MQTLKTHPLVYAGALAVAALAVLPLAMNLKFNDFSKNWLNNDYAKNLLASTEEYSVFMTEGGDNQVFGSLYFTYAVKLRQDLFPYDQKGNIFKRIYGDMRYVTADIVDSRMQTVDRGLFSGQEPFYEAIRTPNPPYLVPYALGKPATYLTWRRPRQHTLGDTYYKPYGMMYKVQPIRYSLMDMLSIVRSASLGQLADRASKDLGRRASDAEVRVWAAELQREGLARLEGGQLVFVKDYPKPFVRDPRNSFITRWDSIKNLPHYDYLSREIVIGYAYESLIYWSEQIREWEYLYEADANAQRRSQILGDIQAAWKEIDRMVELGKYVGYDSPSVLHNMGILLLSFGKDYATSKQDRLPEAIGLWQQGVEQYPYGWSTYNILFWGLMQAAHRYPDRAQSYLDLFDQNLTKMTNAMKHWSSMRKDVTKAEPYRQVLGLIQLRKEFNPQAAAQLEAEGRAIEDMLARRNVDKIRAQNYIQGSVSRLGIVDNPRQAALISAQWLKLWNLFKTDPDYRRWHVQTLWETLQVPGIIDENLYTTVILETERLLPSPVRDSRDLSLLVAVSRIAAHFGGREAAAPFIQKIYRDAKATLSPAEYANLERQVLSFEDSLQ